MMSSSWRDLTIPPVNAIMHSWKFHGRHGCACDQVGARPGKNHRNTSLGNSGTTRKTKDSGRKDTVAVPELQRIQVPHRVFLTGDDVFAQVRFPN